MFITLDIHDCLLSPAPPPFFLFNVFPRPIPCCPMIERSFHTCGFVVKFWDCCENCNKKRNRTKPKSKHCILVRTEESELKDFPGVNTPLDMYLDYNRPTGKIQQRHFNSQTQHTHITLANLAKSYRTNIL